MINPTNKDEHNVGAISLIASKDTPFQQFKGGIGSLAVFSTLRHPDQILSDTMFFPALENREGAEMLVDFT